MFTRFTSRELEAIGDFAEEYCRLYSEDDFPITQEVRGVAQFSEILNAVTRTMVMDKDDMFYRFCRELTRAINTRIGGRGAQVVVDRPEDWVREALNLPEGTALLSIRPRYIDGQYNDDPRRTWSETRLFILDETGPRPLLNFSSDDVMRRIEELVAE